jgi:DNA polymerase-3 subunit delta
VNEIQKVMSLNENYKNSELVDTVLSKNMRKSIKILNDSLNTNEDIILTIKIFLSKLKRLQQLKNNLQIKKNIEATLNSFKPIIFWKDKEILKNQLNLYSIEEIFLLIKKINLLELEIKKKSSKFKLLIK